MFLYLCVMHFINMKYHFVWIALVLFISACQEQNNKPKVMILTDKGNITLELYPEKAPITVANFLKYIEEDRLKEATFYRVVTPDNQPDSDIKIEVIQGGLYEDNHPDALPPIEHESTAKTGILHKDGVISMARYGPGSATIEFFICVGDQPSLDYEGMRNSDGYGFAAFGKVVEGMDVVRIIQSLPNEEQYLNPRLKIRKISVIE